MAVTPDGRRAVSGSGDETLRLWDLESGQTCARSKAIRTRSRTVAVTPDGRRAVSGSEDKTLRVWDLESGQTLRTLEGHTDSVSAVAVTPDGRRAVSASDDKTLRSGIWRAAKRCARSKAIRTAVNAVAVTPDGRRAVSAFGGPDAAALGPGERPNAAHARRPYGLGQCRGGDARRPPCRLGFEDKTLRVWDLESGQTLRTLEGHTRSGQRRGGDARRPPCRLGFGGPNAAGLGPRERPNTSARSKAIRTGSAPWR